MVSTRDLQTKESTTAELKSVRNNNRRDMVIQMYLSGDAAHDIAKAVSLSLKTVYNYINAYKEAHPELKEQSVQERCGSHTNPFKKLQDERDHYKSELENVTQQFNRQLTNYEAQLKQQKEVILVQEQQLREKAQRIQALEAELRDIKSLKHEEKASNLEEQLHQLQDKSSKDRDKYRMMQKEFTSILTDTNTKNQQLLAENEQLRKEIEHLKRQKLEFEHTQKPLVRSADYVDYEWDDTYSS